MCRCLRLAFIIVLLRTIAAPSATAQGSTSAQPPADQLQRAAAHFAQANWRAALDAYSALAASFPSHALSRFRVGVSLLELNRLAEAEIALREGERLGIPAPQTAFRLAQLRAEQRQPDAAIAELERGLAAGLFLAPSTLEGDKHFASLKSHAKWAGLLTAFDAVVRPCLHDRRFREFDFWIGDWDVRPTAQPSLGPPARNTITLDNNGCVLTEHWKAPSGSEGQSFNIFDRSIGMWRQTWVDNVGGQHDYRGSLKDGNMVFTGDTPAPNGRPGRIPTRLTFFHISKDSVRQFSEVSNDSGRTWRTNYDLTYVRRPSDSARVDGPSSADRAAILRIDSAYVRAWLRDDTTAVLALFTPDAVILPPGTAPVTGTASIRAFWWPRDGSRTIIERFDRTIAEISGTADLAFVRGTSTIAWDYTKDGRTTSQTSRSSNLTLMARDSAGQWRIIRQMWSALP